MKAILARLFDHQTLSEHEAYETLNQFSQGAFNASQMASFLTVYNMRDITNEELAGFRNALIDLCIKVDLGGEETVDLCGTGGDGKHTFNISTLASFIVAGAGYKVTKHGNYGVSSISGSSNVLEHLGYTFTNDSDVLKKQLEKSGICFMHAPLFHPALKGVGPIRRELGMKTFFNMLGPLVNPAQPKQQLVGVFNLKLSNLYKFLHESLEKSYAIVYGMDGFDEVSLTDHVKVITNRGTTVLSPDDFGYDKIQLAEISGGSSIGEAAEIFQKIIQGQGTKAQNNVVCANAALAIKCFEPQTSLLDCVAKAEESLFSGKAKASLSNLLSN